MTPLMRYIGMRLCVYTAVLVACLCCVVGAAVIGYGGLRCIQLNTSGLKCGCGCVIRRHFNPGPAELRVPADRPLKVV